MGGAAAALEQPWSRALAAASAHLQDFHLEAAVGGGAVRHLQGLNEGFRELLHHGEDQRFGGALATEIAPVSGNEMRAQRTAPSAQRPCGLQPQPLEGPATASPHRTPHPTQGGCLSARSTSHGGHGER